MSDDELPIAPRGTPEHIRYCAGCYEVEPGVFLYPPRNGGPVPLSEAMLESDGQE